MIVREWMSPSWATLSGETSLPDAVRFMNQRSAPGVVVTHNGVPTGALTRSEAYDTLESGSMLSRKTLSAALPAGIPRLSADDPLERAARIFRELRLAALPVVWKEELAGVLTQADICRAFCDILGDRSPEAPLTMIVSAPRDRDVLDEIRRRAGGAKLQSILAYPTAGKDWLIHLKLSARPPLSAEECA